MIANPVSLSETLPEAGSDRIQETKEGGSGTGSVPLTAFMVCAADRHMSLSYKEDDPKVFNLTLF